jgi:hypothetical protein
MKQKAVIFISLLVFLCNISMAQDVSLVNLTTNAELYEKTNGSRAADFDFFYIIDTIQLPFVDDFSKNFQLRYRDYRPGQPFVTDSAQSVFRINNKVMDTIKYRKTPNHSYYYSVITNRVDTFEMDSVEIEVFSDSLYITYDYGWLAEDYYYSNGELILTLDIDYDSIKSDSVWYQYYVNDTSKHWIDNGAWINSTMAVNPPTIGVATFDGIDSLGHPYDFGSEGTYGPADYLTSYPLDLEEKTDVKMSFYYQAQGLGNEPEGRDSLILEFFGNGNWNYAWSSAGKALSDFEYVLLPITDTIYLYNGFQFRFRNYSTLSGSLDHWHIDYVYLDEGRGSSSEMKDLAFKEVGRTLLTDYISMPYEHYVIDPSAHMKSDVDLDLVNFSSVNLSGVTDYSVINKTDNSEVFNATDLNFVTFSAFTEETINHSILSVNNEFQFPNTGNSTNTFKVQYISNSNTIQASELNPHNDTIAINQVFDKYYAYDDGSPESGFAIAGVGASVANKFYVVSEDTITGVLINFLEMFDDVENTYNVKIWKDDGGFPGEVIYESVGQGVPKYNLDVENREALGFMRHTIDTLIILPSGNYYFGWTQDRLNKFFVGYDMNNDASDKMLYNLNGAWTSFTEPGALMLRPEFGKSTLMPIISTGFEEFDDKIIVYPNPANNYFLVEAVSTELIEVIIFDAFGKLIRTEQEYSNTKINVSGLANGLYIVMIKGNKTSLQEKILIQH